MSTYAEHGSHAGDWLIETARRRPEALLLLAAGCALLARGSMRDGGRPRPRSTGYQSPDWQPSNGGRERSSGVRASLRQAGDYAADLKDRVSDATSYATDLRDRVSDAAGSYAGSAAEYADEARRGLSEGSQRLYRQAQSTVQDTLPRLVREQPLLVAGLGLAAGAAVAAVFPPTSLEKRAAGEARDALADAAGKVGDNLMQAAGKAGENFKGRIAAGGLDADGLKEMAREVASSFTTADQDKGSGQSQGSRGSGTSQYGSSVAASARPQGQGSSQSQSSSQGQGGAAKQGPQGQSGPAKQGSQGQSGAAKQGPSGSEHR